MTRRRPPTARRRRGTPLPTSPLKGGRREGGGLRALLPGDHDVGEVYDPLTL